MIENTYIPSMRTDVVLQDVDGESLILDTSEESIHQLNDTATFILHQCDGKNNVSDITSLVVEHYDISEANARDDVSGVIKQFMGLNLLNEKK